MSPRPDQSSEEVQTAPVPHADARPVKSIHQAVAARLNDDGARYTNGRRALVEILARARQPLTVEELRALSSAPQSSIYRILAVLEDAELVHRFTNTNSEFARFELAEDLTGHHHHLACATCGTMTDVTLPADVEDHLDRAVALLAAQQRFAVDEHRLDIIGTCATCADRR
jgi:Fur family ferric uptake transcriptional regulator